MNSKKIFQVGIGLYAAIAIAACAAETPTGGKPAKVSGIQEIVASAAADPEPDILGAGDDRQVEISGSAFAVMIHDVLSDRPTAEVPVAYLHSVSATTEIPIRSVMFHDGTKLTGVVAATDISALPSFDDFHVRVRNPAAGEASGGQIRVSPWERARLQSSEFPLSGSSTLDVCGYTTVPVSVALGVAGEWLKPEADVRFGDDATIDANAYELVSSVDVTADTAATLTLPAGMFGGKYDVQWVNADGQATAATELFTVDIQPNTCPLVESAVFDVDGQNVHALGCNEVTTPTALAMTFTGVNFGASGTLTFAGPQTSGTMGLVSVVTPTQIVATLPAGVTADTYTVTWTESVVKQTVLPAAFSVVTATCGIQINVSAIDPPFAWRKERNTVNITGNNFPAGATATLVGADGTEYALKFPVAVTDGEMTAVILASLVEAGVYDLRIYGPTTDYVFGELPNAIMMTEDPMPKITSIDPEIVQSNSLPNWANLHGMYFDFVTNVTAVVLDTAESVMALPPVAAISATSVTFSGVDVGTGLLTSATYIIRLYGMKPEGKVWVESVPFVVPDANQKPGSGSLALAKDKYGNAVELPVALMQHAALPVTDAQGNRFIVVAGGRGQSDAGPSADLYVVALDKFGQLTRFRNITEQLVEGRAAFGMVQNGLWLYALGGITSAANGVTSSVERALVLDSSKAPEIQDAAAVSVGGGSLASGRWGYRVAAVYGAGDADNPNGEGIASTLVAAYLSATSNAVRLTWPTVAGAASYRFYRSVTAESDLRDTRFLDEKEAAILCSAGTCTYDDAGANSPAANGKQPLEVGDTGVWQTYMQLQQPRAAAMWQTARSPDSTRYVFALDGVTSATFVPIGTIESLTMGDDGSLSGAASVASTGRTALRSFSFGGLLSDSNMKFLAGSTDNLIFIAGGYTGAGMTVRTDTSEYAQVQNGGTLSAFSNHTPPACGTCKLNTGLAASGMVLVSDRWYYFGGDAQNGSAPTLSGRKSLFSKSGATLQYDNPTAGADMTVKRAHAATLRTMGHIYVFGGTSDGLTALATIEGVAF